jgi:hypothetical protein
VPTANRSSSTIVMWSSTEPYLRGEAGYVAPDPLPEVIHLMLEPAPAFVQWPFFGYRFGRHLTVYTACPSLDDSLVRRSM